MKTQHTPKPWIIDNTMAKDKRINTFWYRIRDDSGNVIAEAKGQHCGINNSTAEANAKLIAAAPYSLESHIKNVELLEDFDFNNYLRLGNNTQKKLDKCIEIMNLIFITSREAIKKSTP